MRFKTSAKESNYFFYLFCLIILVPAKNDMTTTIGRTWIW